MSLKNTCSKCNGSLEPTRFMKQRYCMACHAEFMRLHRPKHSELNDEQRKKANARSYSHVYIKRGKISKQKCSTCQNPKVEAHHENYDKPLEVTWLCRPCHMQLHKFKSLQIA